MGQCRLLSAEDLPENNVTTSKAAAGDEKQPRLILEPVYNTILRPCLSVKIPYNGSNRRQASNHPHSGWLDFALKGRNQKHAVFKLPSSEIIAHGDGFPEDNKKQACPGKEPACFLNFSQLDRQALYGLRYRFCSAHYFLPLPPLPPFPPLSPLPLSDFAAQL
jgi:hypothetical protein